METSWEAPEFEHRPKTALWYWGSMLVTLAVVGIAVWQRNFLFGAFAILAEIMLMVWGDREPRTLRFKVQASNFEVEGVRTYPWNDFEAFSVNGAVSDKWDELVLKFRRPVRPRLRVNVPKGRSEEVVKALGKSLPQVEPEPSFIDNLERFFGF